MFYIYRAFAANFELIGCLLARKVKKSKNTFLVNHSVGSNKVGEKGSNSYVRQIVLVIYYISPGFSTRKSSQL